MGISDDLKGDPIFEVLKKVWGGIEYFLKNL